MPSYPTAFISYSRNDEAHKEWVRQFATQFRADGVDARLDHWHAIPGDQLPEFKEREIRENDYVLIEWQLREQFDESKMVVSEVGFGKGTGRESYRLLYNSPSKGGENLRGQQMDQWFLKTYVDANFELCDYPAI